MTTPDATAWSGPWRLAFRLFATLLGLLGLAMVVLGAWLVSLGGTSYHVLAGGLLVAAAFFALRRRTGLALGLATAAIALTWGWSLVEIQGKGWMPAWPIDLAGRAGLLSGLWVLLGFAWLMGRPAASLPERRVSRRVAMVGLLAISTGLGVLVAIGWERAGAPATTEASASPTADATDWRHFGNTPEGRRYLDATQITPANVHRLREAWRFQSGDLTPDAKRVFYSAQNTPIKVGDLLYVCTPSQRLHALDAGTGAERWRHDPKVSPRAMESAFSAACRAVGHHVDPAAAPEALCASRVLVTAVDGRLFALDAATGRACTGFGDAGVVDLTVGMGLKEPGHASNNSGPTVVGDLVVVGQQVSDNQQRLSPSGVVRAYDAVTGALRWAWDASRVERSQTPLAAGERLQAPLAAGERWPAGTPNVWNVISADPALGLVFMGTGNAGNDHFGGNRDAAADQYSSSVVAVDAATGATRWHYRTVLDDRFDYDIGAQPVLVDVPVDGQPRRAVVQATKTGSLFVLDARTGEPLRPVAMKPAPAGGVAGERRSPVQPQSTAYPNLSGHPGPDPERLDARHAFGLTPIDAAICRIRFHEMRYDGIYTPPTDQGRGTLLFPGTVGGPNWGGIAIDPGRGIIVSNHSRLPNQVLLVPRAEVKDVPIGEGGRRPDQAVAPQGGAPWGVSRPMWLSPLGVPCISPPWGYLVATDLASGRLLWSQPLGTGYDSGPLGIATRLRLPLGTVNLGGAVVTGSGLTFIAAAQDDFFRAFETRTGRLLWSARLPAGGQASAMSYMHRGRQYVAIGATGHARLETTPGDALVVYALPE